jgi:hypothetical protein
MTGNSAENSSASKRNPIAQDLRTPKFRARVIRSRKLYSRKGRVKRVDNSNSL